MVSFNNVFSGGWRDFKANPILLIPGLLFSIGGTLFSIVLLWALFGDIGTAVSVLLGSLDPLFFETMNFDNLNPGLFGLTLTVGFILLLIFYSFIYAGLTGMAKEAALTGSTKLVDFFSYGVLYLLRVLGYTVVIILFIGIPMGILAAIIMVLIIMAAAVSAAVAIILGLLFLLVFLVVGILLLLITYFGTYAIVVDDMGVIESLKKSYYLFMDNKADIFIFVLLIFVIAFGVSFIIGIISAILGFIPVAGAVIGLLIETIIMAVLYTLMFVWGVRMYYELTDETVEEIVYEEFAEYSDIEQGILDRN
ncbi:MAG: hypothetical protein LBE57_07710 [Methanosarcinales archaeon]|jgi:hypothetical protein|nr:hypothetical protein [Methanosarcinales archaeon]